MLTVLSNVMIGSDGCFTSIVPAHTIAESYTLLDDDPNLSTNERVEACDCYRVAGLTEDMQPDFAGGVDFLQLLRCQLPARRQDRRISFSRGRMMHDEILDGVFGTWSGLEGKVGFGEGGWMSH